MGALMLLATQPCPGHDLMMEKVPEFRATLRHQEEVGETIEARAAESRAVV